MSAVTLDAIVADNDLTSIRLLKSDVDGFDYDVLDSASEVLSTQSPILFFECDFRDEAQRTGYFSTIGRLDRLGYSNWVAFDNYGEVVLQTTDCTDITQLLEYVWRQKQHRSTRTIYYFDVLASVELDAGLVSRVVSDYVAS